MASKVSFRSFRCRGLENGQAGNGSATGGCFLLGGMDLGGWIERFLLSADLSMIALFIHFLWWGP